MLDWGAGCGRVSGFLRELQPTWRVTGCDVDAERVLAGVKFANPKGQLQELTQNRHQSAPTYHIMSMEGPAHQRVFDVEVRFNDIPLATGSGSSKRAAEEAAATRALELVRAQPRMLDAMPPASADERVGE